MGEALSGGQDSSHSRGHTLVETTCLELWTRLLLDFTSHHIREETRFRRPMFEEKEINKK